ncbi:hypothetical protein RclHR1_00990011 [Rhizophagus clarus]|uniref:HMG box domain-containing protein n=1 Tax=Rhizophagus clarus TaxID=94130 RepID=A0A2Z6S5Y7_9GLOM|nr:hypothetical protein RclHR1_00990011 [Rhizophagus clarus]GES78754.1 hypothetical protein GLOIN_2v1701679 [Rhizophagus clarus]
MSSTKPSKQEILNRYDEYHNEIIVTVKKLLHAIKIGDIPSAEALLPKSEKKNGQARRPSNSNILCSNQLMKFGIKTIAASICDKYRYNKQLIMVISRRFTGKIWNEVLDDETKKYFDDLAANVDKLHKDKYPNFKLVKTKRQHKNLTIKHYEAKKSNKPERRKKIPLKNTTVTSPQLQTEEESLTDEANTSLASCARILPEYFAQPAIQKTNQLLTLLPATPFPVHLNNHSSIQPVISRYNVQSSNPQLNLIPQHHTWIPPTHSTYNSSNEVNLPTFDDPFLPCEDQPLLQIRKYNNQILSNTSDNFPSTYEYSPFANFD